MTREELIIKCYEELFDILKRSDLSFSNLKEILTEFIEKYDDILNIAKLEVRLVRPTTLIGIEKEVEEIEAYNSYNADKNYEIFEIKTDNGIVATTKAYPKLGTSFKKQEKEIIWRIVSVLFTYFSKSKSLEILSDIQNRDLITGAYNTNGFNKYVREIQSKGIGNEFAALFVNIRDYKYINELIGENEYLIKKLIKKIKKIKAPGEIVARPGLDNTILLVKKENVGKYVELFETFKDERILFNINILCGIAFITNNQVTDAIDNANLALGIVKSKKEENILFYTADIKEEMMRKKEITNNIDKAFEQDELIAVYQPKINATTEELYGAEALVRWKSNGRILFPKEFIEELEKSNKILELDFFMLDRVCKDIREWLDKGYNPGSISINFSMKHIKEKNTIKRIISIIKNYNIDPTMLDIELTELTNFDDLTELIEFINELQKFGLKISMDDFGSGYSTLFALKNLDYDIIKIDKTLVDSIEVGNKKDLIILSELLTMLKTLNYEVVAEGVESLEQKQILTNYGCDYIQGYYYDKPLPKDEYEKRMKVRVYKKGIN